MTIKHNGKNISGEPEWVLTNITDNLNGILTLTFKNQWDDLSKTESIDLSKHKLQLVKLNSQNHLKLLKNGSLAEVNNAFISMYVDKAFKNLSEVAAYRESKVFLVPHHTTGDEEGVYREYMWINNDFEVIGSTDVNLEPFFLKANVYNNLDYSTNDNTKALSAYQGYLLETDKIDKTAIAPDLTTNDDNKVLSAKQGVVLKNNLDNKVDKEQGKSLMTDAERTKLNSIEAEANKTIVDADIKTSSNPVQNTAVKNALSNKVDKETGKSLMTDAERIKLNDIETEANKTNVDTEIKTSDNPVSNTAIKNALSNKVDKETGKGLMTDAERKVLSNKVDKESGKSLIETSKIAKLDGIQEGANKTIVDTEIKTSDNPVSNTAIKNALADMTDIIDANSSNVYEITDDMVNGNDISIDTNHNVFFIYSKKDYNASTYFKINNNPCVDNVNGSALKEITADSLYIIMSLDGTFSVHPITDGLISDNLKNKIKNLNVVDVIEDGNSGVATSNAVNDAIQTLSNNMELTTLDITYTNGVTDQISFYTKPKTSNGG